EVAEGVVGVLHRVAPVSPSLHETATRRYAVEPTGTVADALGESNVSSYDGEDGEPGPTHTTGGGDPSAERRRQRAASAGPARPATGRDSDPARRAREAGSALRGSVPAVAGCARNAERA